MKENHKHANLKDGAEWAEHEDFIIGDEEGLKNLIEACEEALEKGISINKDTGDYVGVKKLDKSWFDDPKDNNSFDIPSVVLVIVLVLILALTLIGGYTVLSWMV